MRRITFLLALLGLLPATAWAQDAPPDDREAPDAEVGTEVGAEVGVESETEAGSEPDAEAAPEDEIPMGLQPPRLLENVAPEWPAEALETDVQSANVVLTILITPEGTVTETSVAQSSGNASLDAAAIEAAGRLVFAPATRDREPIAARINFQFRFERPAPPEPPPPTTGVLEGTILSGDEPLAGAQVFVDGPVSQEGATDDAGRFRFEELPEGDYTVGVAADGHDGLDRNETVVAGEALDLTYRLTPARTADDGDEALPELGVTAVVDRPRREATRRTLEREVLTSMPGTRGDALRVVELLPGVARPSFGSGALYIRGAAPGDSEVFVDGVSVPLLYHFGGLTSFYQGRLIDRIDFIPGNFGVRYGRRIGGILEVHPRDPNPDRNFHGMLDINLIDSSLVLETPLWEGAAIALAARRSYVDFFFAEVVPDDAFDVLAAPVYYDYQLVFTWQVTDQDKLRVLGYGSSDEFRTIFNGDTLARPFGLELSTQFHRLQATWERRWDDNFRQEVMFAGGWTGLVIQAGQSFGFDADFVPLTMRAEWQLDLHERVTLRWGMDWAFTPTNLAFRGPSPGQLEGAPMQRDPNAPDAAASFDGNAYRPALYAESTLNPIDPLTFVLGLRVDYFRDIESWTFDPRLTSRIALNDQFTLKAGIGLFSQAPEFQESAPGLGNPDLAPITSLHTSAGVEFNLDEVWQFEVEGYYKHIWNRVTATERGVAPFFTNDGQGRIYGAEVSIRARANNNYPIYGFLSYTLSRSERQDREDPWRLFDFDQTHILSLAVVWRIGDGWEAGGTFRLVSGNPFTPITGSVYDVTSDRYQPLYGAVNSDRYNAFHRLDLRVQKTFVIEDTFRLSIYLDVQNVYNQQNREATSFSYDYAESADINGLPILPSLGIRGEL